MMQLTWAGLCKRKFVQGVHLRICSGSGGFTLIEAVLAMGILAVGLMALASLQITAVKVNSAASKMTIGAHAGQNLLERLMGLPYDHADLAASEDSHELKDLPPGYTIEWRVAEAANAKMIRVKVVWGSGGRDKSFEFSGTKLRL
jgi:Tfp pilus assembly protein PilV